MCTKVLLAPLTRAFFPVLLTAPFATTLFVSPTALTRLATKGLALSTVSPATLGLPPLHDSFPDSLSEQWSEPLLELWLEHERLLEREEQELFLDDLLCLDPQEDDFLTFLTEALGRSIPHFMSFL